MAIPDFQSIMLPLLNALKDGQEHSNADLIVRLSSEFGLTDEEKRQLLPSGTQPIFNNRFGWAKTYMLKAGLL